MITIEDAFELLEMQSTSIELDENFIGFTHPKNDQVIIQFVRDTEVNWTLDVPTYNGEGFDRSLSAPIPHSFVFILVRDFFDPNSKLQALLSERQYDELRTLFSKFYKIFLVYL